MSTPKPTRHTPRLQRLPAPAARVALLSQIEIALRPLADPAQAAPMRAYMLDASLHFSGVRATPRRQALAWPAPVDHLDGRRPAVLG